MPATCRICTCRRVVSYPWRSSTRRSALKRASRIRCSTMTARRWWFTPSQTTTGPIRPATPAIASPAESFSKAVRRLSVARPRRRSNSARDQHPVIEIEQNGGGVVLALLFGEDRARTGFCRHGAQPQRADVVSPRQFAGRQHLGPSIHGAAREQRRDGAAAVDGGDVKRVGETIERDRTRQGNDVAAVDQPASEAALRRRELIEVDARC